MEIELNINLLSDGHFLFWLAWNKLSFSFFVLSFLSLLLLFFRLFLFQLSVFRIFMILIWGILDIGIFPSCRLDFEWKFMKLYGDSVWIFSIWALFCEFNFFDLFDLWQLYCTDQFFIRNAFFWALVYFSLCWIVTVRSWLMIIGFWGTNYFNYRIAFFSQLLLITFTSSLSLHLIP
jgi:hypothetical protein